MRGFAFALGIRCPYCHAEKTAPEKGLDFPADTKQEKKDRTPDAQMV